MGYMIDQIMFPLLTRLHSKRFQNLSVSSFHCNADNNISSTMSNMC